LATNPSLKDQTLRHKKLCYVLINLFSLIGFMLSGGCAGISSNARIEPEIFVVRNTSGQHITSFSLAVAANSNNAMRYGTIAPVPMGASQVYIRPASAPRLPNDMMVEWVTADGKTHRRNVSLKHALKQTHYEPDNALVFEILPRERVDIYMEKLQ
jgi:hypothetical protein